MITDYQKVTQSNLLNESENNCQDSLDTDNP